MLQHDYILVIPKIYSPFQSLSRIKRGTYLPNSPPLHFRLTPKVKNNKPGFPPTAKWCLKAKSPVMDYWRFATVPDDNKRMHRHALWHPVGLLDWPLGWPTRQTPTFTKLLLVRFEEKGRVHYVIITINVLPLFVEDFYMKSLILCETYALSSAVKIWKVMFKRWKTSKLDVRSATVRILT